MNAKLPPLAWMRGRPAKPENAAQENLTPEILNGLLFMTGPLYWIIVAAGMVFMAPCNIDQKQHEEMMAVLEERRAVALPRKRISE